MESQNVVINDTIKLDEPCFDFGGDDDSSLDENDHLNVSKEIENDGKILNDQSVPKTNVPNSDYNEKSKPKNEQVSDFNHASSESESENSRDENTKAHRLRVSTNTRTRKDHDPNLILGDLHDKVKTRSRTYNDASMITCFLSMIEPKNVDQALNDSNWINAMHDELNQFKKQNVWTLVERPSDKNVIGTKWIFKNKLDEFGNVSRNKARLVAQGYTQLEGIDFHETFAPVARIESIRLMFCIACFYKFKLFQMDVKSAFLNGILNEEIYVEQPKGFVDQSFPNHVFKLTKALYGLKQAPRAWYDKLSSFLLSKGFHRGSNDKTLFLKNVNSDLIVAQIYVDDIIFGSTNETYAYEFSNFMKNEFEMSMMGELTFFLGLQVIQHEKGIFINQGKYARELIKKFGLENAKTENNPCSTSLKLKVDECGETVNATLYRSMIGSLLYLCSSRPDLMYATCACARYQSNPKVSHLKAVKRILKYVKGTLDLGVYYTNDTNCVITGFSDSDWAGNEADRKSTSGVCCFIGNNLVSWSSKKQNCISISTAEAEYVSAGHCATQLLWLKSMIKDYGINQETMVMLCDNMSAINISKNPVQHSRTKHIDIRYHFIKDLVEQKIITLEYIDTSKQLSDIFTKPLGLEKFVEIRQALGCCTFTP